MNKPCSDIESERGFATDVITPGIDVSMNSPLAGVALRNDLFSIEDSLEAERDRLL